MRESLNIQHAVDDMTRMTNTLEDLARVAGARGNAGRMVTLLGATATIRRARGIPVSAVERRASEDAVAIGHAALDETAFTSAWAYGAALTLEEAIALAGDASR